MKLFKLETPEMRAHAIQRLADLDTIIEPIQREREDLMRYLGLIPLELGIEQSEL